jgi:NAD(P)-dependent dehydrogenase (short-subunit alcohol dehydrogenase family)
MLGSPASLAFGGVDLVVNNAGLSVSRSLLETTEADWDRQHDVMAKGLFLVSQAAAKAMIAQGLGGDIVYIVSKNAIFAAPNNVAYGAAKADRAHQVRLLAAELGEHGIRVNGVNPDGVVRGSGIFARGWGAQRAAVAELLTAAAARAAVAVVDIDDPMFLRPGDMPARIAQACRSAGQPVPADEPGIVRCIVDSLARAHRKAIEDASRLSGRDVEVVHLVGGGSRNDLLCQATADACGLPVVAGPAEATAIGNILIQARTLSRAASARSERQRAPQSRANDSQSYDLAALRTLVRASFPTRTFHPAR